MVTAFPVKHRGRANLLLWFCTAPPVHLVTTNVFNTVALFSPDNVDDLVFAWAQEQLQEQLQVFPPRIVSAVSVLISVTRFSVISVHAPLGPKSSASAATGVYYYFADT